MANVTQLSKYRDESEVLFPRSSKFQVISARPDENGVMRSRYIAPLSHPDEHEVALLPGTILLPVGSVNVEGLSNPVILLAEPGEAPQLPTGPADLRAAVVAQVRTAFAARAVPIHSPGRFTPAGRPA